MTHLRCAAALLRSRCHRCNIDARIAAPRHLGLRRLCQQVARKKPREELSSAAGAAAARLSKRLVTIRTDIDLPPLRFEWDALRLREPDAAGRAAIAETFAALEFVQHARRLDAVWAALFPAHHALAAR